MHQIPSFRWITLAGVVILLAPVLYGSKRAWELHANRVVDWLPESFEETQRLWWFVERFGSEELLMVSWPDCTLRDERLAQLSQRLLQPVPHQGRTVQWYRQVWAGPGVLQMLMSEPLSMSRDEAMQRLRGWLLSEDGQLTCAVALVSSEGMADRHAAIGYLWDVAEAIPGLGRDRMRVAGTTYDGVAIDEASRSSLLEFNSWSLAICFLWMLVFLRSVKLAWFVFFTAFFSQQLSMALMYYSGQQMDSVLLLVANLAFVLGVAGGVHLVNYYRDARRSDRPDAVTYAVQAARKPLLMASMTTALGAISLTVSQIKPIRSFGVYAAVSILAGVAVLLWVLPAAVTQWPPSHVPRRSARSSAGSAFGGWRTLTSGIVRARWAVLICGIILLVMGIAGIARLRTSTRLHDLFAPSAKVVQDYEWFEEHIGYLIPVEIVLRFPLGDQQTADEMSAADRFVARMRFSEQVGVEAAATPGVGTTVSAASFAPPLPETTSAGLRQVVQRRLLARRLYARRHDFRATGYYRTYAGEELWRVSVRVSARRGTDYGRLLESLRERITPMLSAMREEERPAMVLCGGVPLIDKAQRELLHDLVASFGLAVAMIAAVMVILLRSLTKGLLAMIPNVLPTILVFGAMGWLGLQIEIGSMLTASAALGIAVDDTLHYVTWFRRGLQERREPAAALEFAYERCGAAMVQTSLICSLGLVVFALSPFMPIARFAWLMFTLLLLALVCDLLVLPAVLAVSGPSQRPGRDPLEGVSVACDTGS